MPIKAIDLYIFIKYWFDWGSLRPCIELRVCTWAQVTVVDLAQIASGLARLNKGRAILFLQGFTGSAKASDDAAWHPESGTCFAPSVPGERPAHGRKAQRLARHLGLGLRRIAQDGVGT